MIGLKSVFFSINTVSVLFWLANCISVLFFLLAWHVLYRRGDTEFYIKLFINSLLGSY
jgi:hypothetical protein